MGAKSQAIASLLAQLGEALATNPTQKAVAGIARQGIGAFNQAKAFNQQEQETSNRLLETLNEPRAEALQGGPGANPLSIPGAPGTPGVGGSTPAVTLAEGGFGQPGRIDPFRAIALGQAGTQQVIQRRQQERFETQRQLERQQDFSNRLKVIEETRKNQESLFKFQMEQREAQDIERGGPATRAGQAELLTQDVAEGRREAEVRPTVGQEQRLTAADVKRSEAEASIAGTRAEFQPQLSAAQLQTAQKAAGLSPSEIATTQRSAIKQVTPGMLRQVSQRLKEGDPQLSEVQSLLQALGGEDLDEAGRRSNFNALTELLTEDELEFFQGQIVRAETAITAGQLPSSAVPFGTTVPEPIGPMITDVQDVSLQLVLQEEDFLRSSGRF